MRTNKVCFAKSVRTYVRMTPLVLEMEPRVAGLLVPQSTKLSSHNPMESPHLANEVENNTRYSFLAPVTSGVL